MTLPFSTRPIKSRALIPLLSMLESVTKNLVYTEASGRLTTGLRRRGGFGFIPKWTLTPEHQLLNALPLEGKTVYDLGGFHGMIAMFFARKVGDGGQVITFEPNPVNFRAILDHIALNDFDNIKPIQTGVGSKRETLNFLIPSRLPARGTVNVGRKGMFSGRKDLSEIKIEVESLDNLVKTYNLPHPDFVKIDVEGMELDVLQGMLEIISNCKPEMVIELHFTNDQKVAEFLLQQGYSLTQVEKWIPITRRNLELSQGHLYAQH